MDLKRVYPGKNYQTNPVRGSKLENPMISLANASTPVRKRIVKPAQPLNSTPINIHKIGNQIKSPTLSNKQNAEILNPKMQERNSKIYEKNINLSPILALNRKMSSGPRIEQRCFTPTGVSKDESLSNLLDQNSDEFGQNVEYFSNNANEQSKTSNFFKKMLGSRSKTPTRMGFGENRQSMNNNCFGAFKGSGTFNNTISRLKESKSGNLMSSDSFDSFRSAGAVQLRQNQIPCINQHERKTKAKYKVIEENEIEDQDMLVYCSRCAILLVKKGFKVQELTANDVLKIKLVQKKLENERNNYRQNSKFFDYAQQTHKRLKIKLEEILGKKQVMFSIHAKTLEDINCYYDSIIALVQQQRVKDRQKIHQAREQDKNQGEIIQIKLIEAIKQLESMIKISRVGAKQLQIIQNLESLMTQNCVYTHRLNNNPLVDNIQQKFNQFTEYFESLFRLNFEGEETSNNGKLQNNYNSFKGNFEKPSADCPLRFSFEKDLNEQEFRHKSKPPGDQFRQMNSQIDELEGEESGEMSNQNEKKAFRTLFPQDAQQQQNGKEEKTGLHSPTFKQF